MKTIIFFILILISYAQSYGQSSWVVNYSTDNTFNDIFFIDENTGWIAGGKPFSSGLSSIIIKTTNGGQNWVTQVSPRPNEENTAISFINENTGWMTTTPSYTGGSDWYSYLMYTINGGDFWYEIPIGSIGVKVNSIAAVSPTTVFFASGVGYSWGFGYTNIGNIHRTSNSGLNFTHYFFNDSSDCYFNKVQFVNQNTDGLIIRDTPIPGQQL